MIDYPVTNNDFSVFEAVKIPKAEVILDLPLGNRVDLSKWAVEVAPNGSPIVKSNIEAPMTNSNPKPITVVPEVSTEAKVDASVDAGISLEELIKQENLPIRITSGYRGKGSLRGGKTAQGKRSNHNRLDANGNPMAYDIAPAVGKTFADVRNAIKNNPRVLAWFQKRGWGILEEMQDGKRGFYDISGKFHYTGATGPHFHLGPDTYGRQWFNRKYIAKGEQGLKITPFGVFEPILVEKPTIKFPLMDKEIELPDNIATVTPEGTLIATDNSPMTNSNPTPVDTTQTTSSNTSNLEGNKKKAMDFFINKGLAKHQAAGLVGNLIRESGLNISAVNPYSGAVGIAQWLGSRKNKLFNTYGKNPSFEQQLEFVWQELNSSHKKGLQTLLNSQTVDEAAANAFGYYEFSVGPKGAIADMRRHGQDGLGAYEKGLKFARELV